MPGKTLMLSSLIVRHALGIHMFSVLAAGKKKIYITSSNLLSVVYRDSKVNNKCHKRCSKCPTKRFIVHSCSRNASLCTTGFARKPPFSFFSPVMPNSQKKPSSSPSRRGLRRLIRAGPKARVHRQIVFKFG
ncbi:hypothetical protein IW261DRAFT_176312 [Armillaria novae-zelandiae]|uniref:Secreted protein n=1 Tax=Armillaria novae-zelandiae TaxID=153914 RepID=A0AA39TQ80_9AGAR|nr:hypothetical protein IW261DRAFT_176312 [Armillaria novae-zelandiae]